MTDGPASAPPLPPGRMVELPGRGTTFVRVVVGPPHAPTLVLLHGWTSTADINWFPSFAALVADGDDGSCGHDALDGVLDDLGVLEDRLQCPDPSFHVALLVLGRVVVAVLGQVAQLTSALDGLRDLDAAASRQVVVLGPQPLVRAAGQLVRLRHARGGYRRAPPASPGLCRRPPGPGRRGRAHERPHLP